VEQNSSSRSQLQSALNKIYFNFDSAGLSEPARSTLSKNAGILKHESAAKILIEGNCDERGSAEYNLALGERRARAAQQYLVTLGIDPARLSVVSYGKEKPASTTNDEAAWAKNRRAEFVVAQPINIASQSAQ
jgi:peptidoglycan-associated lipoprotein